MDFKNVDNIEELIKRSGEETALPIELGKKKYPADSGLWEFHRRLFGILADIEWTARKIDNEEIVEKALKAQEVLDALWMQERESKDEAMSDVLDIYRNQSKESLNTISSDKVSDV